MGFSLCFSMPSYRTICSCKTERITQCCLTSRRSQPPLALSVPLSRFTSRVGGGSAFFVRRHEIMQASKPLNRKLAIILALAVMWLVSVIGAIIGSHSVSLWFIGIDLHGYDAVTIGQVGSFYLAWVGCQFPAVSFAGMIIGSSDFAHPLRTTFWTMVGYHLLFSAIRAVHWPWTAFHDLDQSIPILA